MDVFPRNVTEIVVPSDMCIGCGVCAGVCPAKCLEMRMENGQYKPVLVSECLPKCNLCLEVCPFFDHDVYQDDLAKVYFGQEPGVKVDPVVGYYLDCLIGYSNVPGHREKGASGGMVTWLLERLLDSGEVDRVVTDRARTKGSGPLFEMAILDNIEDVRGAAGSCYYPVELSGPLQQIWTDKVDRRYAVVGIPCFLHGVRRAMIRHGRLRRRIAYLLGLACGFCPTAWYTEVLAAWVGVRLSEVQTVGYRFKDGISMAEDYRFRAQRRNGEWSRPVGFLETWSHLWGRYYFAHNTCNYCDDVFAEVADAVFMDAWLPALLSETRGTSIVVTRQPRLRDIFIAGIQEGTCTLSPCPIEDVLTSQESVIQQKRGRIQQCLAVARERDMWLPKMRAEAAANVSASDRQTVHHRMRTIRASKRFWRYFRRLPSAALPFFFWAVDTYAGGIVYGAQSLVRVLKKLVRKWIFRKLPNAWRKGEEQWESGRG